MSANDFKQGKNLEGVILAKGQLSATTETTVYTVPAASSVKVSTAVIHNASAATVVSVEVSVVPAGGSITGTNKRDSLVSNLTAGDSVDIWEIVDDFWGTGVVLSLKASTAAAINYKITGVVSS